MTQHEHLHLLGGGRAAQQQDQARAPCRKIRYSNRNDTTVIVPRARSTPLTAGRRRADILEPHTLYFGTPS